MKQLSSTFRACKRRLIARYPSMAKYLFLFRVDRWLIPIVLLAMALCGGRGAVNSEMDRQFFMPEKIAWIDETLSEVMARIEDNAIKSPRGEGS